jgi:hypothetical protein
MLQSHANQPTYSSTIASITIHNDHSGSITISLPEHFSLCQKANTLQMLVDKAKLEMSSLVDELVLGVSL